MNIIDNEKLNYYLALWDLSKPQFLTQTMTSHIYTVIYETETVILKLLSPSETDEQRGAVALRYFDGHGAVRLLRYDQGAQLMEYAAGDELVTVVERGEDVNATRIIAQVIQQLHSVPQNIPHDGLFLLERWFEALFNKAASDKRVSTLSMYVVPLSLSGSSLTSARCEFCMVISITAIFARHPVAGLPSTRKA